MSQTRSYVWKSTWNSVQITTWPLTEEQMGSFHIWHLYLCKYWCFFSAVVVVVLVWHVISWFHSCCGTSISLYTFTRPSSIIVASNALPVFSSDCESHLIFGSNPVAEHSIFCGSELDWPTLGTTESSMVGSSEKYNIKIKCQVLSEEKNYTSLIKCNILHQLLSPV